MKGRETDVGRFMILIDNIVQTNKIVLREKLVLVSTVWVDMKRGKRSRRNI